MKKYSIILIVVILFLNNISFGENLTNNIKERSTKDWTLIIYCGGDEEDPNPIYTELLDKLLNLQYNIDTSILNTVVLFDYCEIGCFFGQVVQTNNNKAKLEIIEEYDELNMGDYNTLKNFLNRCKNDYPAERYFLQMIGHANGFFGANIDTCPPSDSYNYLSMKEIENAISNSLGKVDILAQTGCSMGMIECAYQFIDITDVYISSQDLYIEPLVPNTVIEDFKVLQEHTEKSNYDISVEIVNNLKMYTTNPSFTLSAIRTDYKLGYMKDYIDELGKYFIENMDEYYSKINRSLDTCVSYGIGVDIYDFLSEITSNSKHNCKSIMIKNSDEEFKQLAENIKDLIDYSVIIEKHGFKRRNTHGLTVFFAVPDYVWELENYDFDFFTPLESSNWLNFLDQYIHFEEDPDFSLENSRGLIKVIKNGFTILNLEGLSRPIHYMTNHIINILIGRLQILKKTL